MLTKEEKNYLSFYHGREGKIYMPNELFDDLVKSDLLRALPKSRANHISFAFAFYYFITHLYRECKHSLEYDIPTIKRILGYDKNNKKLNYIIKENGVLDQLGYTESTTNYPLWWHLDDFNQVYFEMLHDLDDVEREDYRYKTMRIKYPIKAFYRTEEAREEDVLDGTFYQINSTTMVPFDVFEFCMDRKDLGVKGFYLYSYMTYKSNYYGGAFNDPLPSFAGSVGFSEPSLVRTLMSLESYNMISNSHEDYIVGRTAGKKTFANKYSVKPFHVFCEEKKEIETRRVLTNEQHEEILSKYQFDDSQLPF